MTIHIVRTPHSSFGEIAEGTVFGYANIGMDGRVLMKISGGKAVNLANGSVLNHVEGCAVIPLSARLEVTGAGYQV